MVALLVAATALARRRRRAPTGETSRSPLRRAKCLNCNASDAPRSSVEHQNPISTSSPSIGHLAPSRALHSDGDARCRQVASHRRGHPRQQRSDIAPALRRLDRPWEVKGNRCPRAVSTGRHRSETLRRPGHRAARPPGGANSKLGYEAFTFFGASSGKIALVTTRMGSIFCLMSSDQVESHWPESRATFV